MSLNTLLNINKTLISIFQLNFPKKSYAKAATSVSMLGMKKKKMVKSGPAIEKKVLPVETDPNRLVNYCCGSNIYLTGEDIKLAPNSEYPEWLWSIRTGPTPPLEDLDPNSMEYWRKVRKMAIKQNMQLLKLKKF
ncbi:large ribosomal subunit protein mL54 isoform X2 [Euwallacea fornicatus]|uniref:large ribosomal subunit protein mL54 isoform X2 n=1 Tax=Euwallacea fornicatus TaxID=995702 RepID=UPI0033902901